VNYFVRPFLSLFHLSPTQLLPILGRQFFFHPGAEFFFFSKQPRRSQASLSAGLADPSCLPALCISAPTEIDIAENVTLPLHFRKAQVRALTSDKGRNPKSLFMKIFTQDLRLKIFLERGLLLLPPYPNTTRPKTSFFPLHPVFRNSFPLFSLMVGLHQHFISLPYVPILDDGGGGKVFFPFSFIGC